MRADAGTRSCAALLRSASVFPYFSLLALQEAGWLSGCAETVGVGRTDRDAAIQSLTAPAPNPLAYFSYAAIVIVNTAQRIYS